MNLLTNDDVTGRAFSASELETVAASFFVAGWIMNPADPGLNELQLIMGYRYHPPLPSGGPGPKGGPYRV